VSDSDSDSDLSNAPEEVTDSNPISAVESTVVLPQQQVAEGDSEGWDSVTTKGAEKAKKKEEAKKAKDAKKAQKKAERAARAAPTAVNSRAAGLGEPSVVKRSVDGNNNVTSVTINRATAPEPPKVNSRIAGLLDEENAIKEKRIRDVEERAREMEISGPAPMVQNSRFAAAAAADEASRMPPRDMTPLTVQNSRFAAAADADREYQDRKREEFEARGPAPVVQNSRFAMAADADREYQERRREEVRVRRAKRIAKGYLLLTLFLVTSLLAITV